MKMFLSTVPRPLLAAGLMLFAVGCNRDSVKVYKVENADAPPTAASPVMPTTMPGELPAPDNSGLPKLKYTLPDGWKEKPLTQLRIASFTVTNADKNAEISVIPLGGMSGGDAANVNRWRSQIELTQLDEETIKKSAEAVKIAGQPGALYDLLGTGPCSGEPERILGAILHGNETAWYFKMTGAADLVENQKANFIAFLKSVEFQTQTTPATMDLSQLPPSHPKMGLDLPKDGNTVIEMDTNSPGKPTWTVPADWKEGQLAQFLVAKFIIGNGDATAAVNVSSLAGDGGGELANLNRWRGQLGLEPMTTEISPPRIGPPGASVQATGVLTVDYTGTDARTGKPARLVGSIVPQNGQTWFYKLMGDPAVVDAQKEAFIQFVQSAKYPVAP